MTANNLDDIALCNVAITELGAQPITTLDPAEATTNNERHCITMYPIVLNALLGKHPWNFGTKERQLNLDPDRVADFGYKFAYRLPSDLLEGPFAVFANGKLRHPVQLWKCEGDYVHANYTRVDILYRTRPSIGTWPSVFIQLFTKDLASHLAKPVCDNAELKMALREEAYGPPEMNGEGGLYAAAKRLNAQSKPMKSIFQNGDPLTTARLGGFGNPIRRWPSS